MSFASANDSFGHVVPCVRRLASSVALSASKSTLRCWRMPKPASHASTYAEKLPVSCWLMNTPFPAAPRLRASPSFRLASVRAASHSIGFHTPFSFTIGPRTRSGLYSPCSAAWPRAHSAPRLSG